MTRMRVFTQSGTPLPRFIAHRGAVLRMALSPDGGVLATGGEDGAIRFWNTEGRHLVAEIILPMMGVELGHMIPHPYAELTYAHLPQYVTALDWSRSGKRLVAARYGHMFVIGATSHTLLRWIGPQKGQIWDARWLGPSDGHVGSVCLDGRQRNWPATKHKKVERPSREISLPLEKPWLMVPSANGWWTFVGGAGGGLLLDSSIPIALKDWTQGIEAAGWSADQTTVYTVDYGGTLRVFDTGGYCVAPSFPLHDTMARCMAKPRGSSIAATGDEGGLVKVWHEGLGVLAELQGHAGSVRCVAATPRFERVYTGGEDGVIREWTNLPVDRALREARAKIKMDQPALPVEGERNLEV